MTDVYYEDEVLHALDSFELTHMLQGPRAKLMLYPYYGKLLATSI
jgi:hypothetical protein